MKRAAPKAGRADEPRVTCVVRSDETGVVLRVIPNVLRTSKPTKLKRPR